MKATNWILFLLVILSSCGSERNEETRKYCYYAHNDTAIYVIAIDDESKFMEYELFYRQLVVSNDSLIPLGDLSGTSTFHIPINTYVRVLHPCRTDNSYSRIEVELERIGTNKFECIVHNSMLHDFPFSGLFANKYSDMPIDIDFDL